ncbi:MFS transporter [uncultured Eubacterium sp.]|uniref:MFS transporter n=1 Tax=uncultured Eubacterium sp. TaxID=165185 RepID=UPI0025E85011|nr:glycoside-pentoside-hexuronide (GPH):cation symporter [uncultured Eubacterium sp.]
MKTTKPFGIADKLGYMFGDFANDFTFLLSSSFLLKFYTDVMGVKGSVVGIVMMVARFVDAFTDVGMGRICDRSKTTKNGKFKPWILRMCGPVALMSFLMYQSSLANMSMGFKIGYLVVTYILWGSVFYTSVNIPYGSMASAISENPSDRQSLSTFRTMGGVLAGGIITAGLPMIIYDNNIINGRKFTIVAGACSVGAIICYLLCYSMVTERVIVEPDADALKNNNVGVMLKNAFSNRALISIIVASIVMLLAQLTLQSMSNYVFPNFYHNAKAITAGTGVMGVSMILSAVLAKPVSNKIGKAELGAIASIFGGLMSLLAFFIRPSNVWVFIVIQSFTWLGLGMFQMIAWALITDVIDYSEIRNGIREDGSVYALYSFARKLGQAASAGLSGVLLDMVGYSQQTQFDTDVVNGIFNITTLVPAIGFIVLGLVLYFWYPLHKKQVDENVEKLRQLHLEDK